MFPDDCPIFKATGQCGDSSVDECRKCEFNEHICDLISDFEDDIDKSKDKMLDKIEQSVAQFIKKERANEPKVK